MNVLGICSNPHADGNTAHALRYALQAIESEGIETAYISLADVEIGSCKGCFSCRNGPCVQQDDMTGIVEAIDACDELILASPVYVGLVTGQIE